MVKLKLQINLSSKMDVTDSGLLKELYDVYISVLDKDERFDVNYGNDNTLLYNGTGTFIIKTTNDNRFGGIITDGILIPSMDRLGIEYKKSFNTEKERYEYLKKLYTTIKEWSNYWWGFSYDEESKFTTKENIWEVTCDTIYTGFMENYL